MRPGGLEGRRQKVPIINGKRAIDFLELFTDRASGPKSH
jgi:hypothetical protein